MVENQDLAVQSGYSSNMKLRDLEEKQNLLKDRVLLIGENLVGFREEVSSEMNALKRDVEILKEAVERLRGVTERLSEEVDSKARKDDLDILKRQAKMFEPLNLATIDEVKKLIKGGSG